MRFADLEGTDFGTSEGFHASIIVANPSDVFGLTICKTNHAIADMMDTVFALAMFRAIEKDAEMRHQAR